MVSLAQQSGISPILTTLTPVGPRFLFPYLRRGEFSWKNKEAENEAIQEFNNLLRNYARKNEIPLIDFHKALTDANGILIRRYSIVDGEHINHEGYALLSLFLQKNLEAIFHNQKEKYGAVEISS
jgi:lysophospholipase L1-like esterase